MRSGFREAADDASEIKRHVHTTRAAQVWTLKYNRLNLIDTTQCQKPGLARLVFSQTQPRARATEARVMRRYRRARLDLVFTVKLRNQVRFRMTY